MFGIWVEAAEIPGKVPSLHLELLTSQFCPIIRVGDKILQFGNTLSLIEKLTKMILQTFTRASQLPLLAPVLTLPILVPLLLHIKCH